MIELHPEVLLPKARIWKGLGWKIPFDTDDVDYKQALAQAMEMIVPIAEMFGSIARLRDGSGNIVGHTTRKDLRRGYRCDILSTDTAGVEIFVHKFSLRTTVGCHYLYIKGKIALVHPDPVDKEMAADLQLQEWDMLEDLIESAGVVPISIHVTGPYDKSVKIKGILFQRLRDKKQAPNGWSYILPINPTVAVNTTTLRMRILLNAIVDRWEP